VTVSIRRALEQQKAMNSPPASPYWIIWERSGSRSVTESPSPWLGQFVPNSQICPPDFTQWLSMKNHRIYLSTDHVKLFKNRKGKVWNTGLQRVFSRMENINVVSRRKWNRPIVPLRTHGLDNVFLYMKILPRSLMEFWATIGNWILQSRIKSEHTDVENYSCWDQDEP